MLQPYEHALPSCCPPPITASTENDLGGGYESPSNLVQHVPYQANVPFCVPVPRNPEQKAHPGPQYPSMLTAQLLDSYSRVIDINCFSTSREDVSVSRM